MAPSALEYTSEGFDWHDKRIIKKIKGAKRLIMIVNLRVEFFSHAK
jgi:hypothetical protein